ncbi:MAG: PASTA domain-containing protein [Synergistales bacterium]|nr:PASTA domain-containing protein [Synergistales bacterium]
MKRFMYLSFVVVLLVIVASGALTLYYVFWGGEEISTPPLEGMSAIEAVEIAQQHGLLVRMDKVDSLKEPGIVLSQWPEAGSKIKEGKVLILKISKGGDRVALPNLRGMEFNEAVATLEEEGFTAGDIVRIDHPDVLPGTVIAQSPSAPARLPKGERIDLLISRGPSGEGGTVSVPDVTGREEAVARRLLAGAGLQVQDVRYTYTQNTPEGIVVSLSPAPGTTLRHASGITLEVATNRRAEASEPENPTPTPSQTVRAPGMADGVADEEQQVATDSRPEEQPPAETEETAETVSPDRETEPEPTATPTPTPVPGKLAKIRYQVPPLSDPLNLLIEMVDEQGSRKILDREVSSGEYVKLDKRYVGSAVVTIYLGGEFVWQERYR